MELIQSTVAFFRDQDGVKVSRGSEWQRYVLHDDGTVCLNVFSKATDLGITREVTLNLDAQWRPLDCYVRIHHGTRVEGAGWFRFYADQVVAEVENFEAGLTSVTRAVEGGPAVFCAHPIATDALIAAAYNRGSASCTQLLDNVFLSSPHHFGATGPELAHTGIEMSFLGSEEIRTANSVFGTDHWQIAPGNERTGHTHPGEDIWTLSGTFIFVRAELPTLGYTYELQSYSREEL